MRAEDISVGEKLIAAEGAKRLLADPILRDLFDELIARATRQAILDLDPTQREAQRQLVLAIAHIRAAIEEAAAWQEEKADERRASQFE